MLSAIAARKARLSLQHQNIPSPSLSTKSSTKRRHHTAAANPSSKKAKKATAKSHSEQKNDITTTVSTVSLDYSDDDSNMSITLDQQEPSPVLHERPLGPSPYSPSRPVVPLADSSDYASDASESEQLNTDLSQFLPYNRAPIEEPQILSTYRPIHGQNLFQLSLDEGSALGLSGHAITLILSPSATLSFVGTYRLRILRGFISLLGTIIPPSQVLHHVFAPRSSPIPVIEALAAHGESSKSLYDIPTRITSIIDEGDVIIVLQELRTGIEGLGRVMRTFEGVFHQADPERTSDIPLGGVHFVCSFILQGRSLRSLGTQVSQAVRGMHAFQVPPSWEATFSVAPFLSADDTTGLSKPHVLLVKGRKNSGKSTFARMLVNRLSSRYAADAIVVVIFTNSYLDSVGLPSSNVT